ncbi:MAG TPA: hypothetical protein VKV28_15150 [Candidatus Binataceae bacterium]|nr:hypothetical protein [Candidatus Binataceae bacterium]
MRLVALGVLALVVSGCALNLDQRHFFPSWDKLETGEALAFAALSIGDGITSTRNTAAGCSEGDPLVTGVWGTKYPSTTDYALGLAFNTAVVMAVAEVLPRTWRKLWLMGFIGGESWAVINNLGVNCFHPPAPEIGAQ